MILAESARRNERIQEPRSSFGPPVSAITRCLEGESVRAAATTAGRAGHGEKGPGSIMKPKKEETGKGASEEGMGSRLAP